MQTLNAVGKHGSDLVKFLKESLKDNENELKILIDGPVQVEESRKFLEPLGFANFVIEDDEGTLYLSTSKLPAKQPPAPSSSPSRVSVAPVSVSVPHTENVPKQNLSKPAPMVRPMRTKPKDFKLKPSTGVLISGEVGTGKYKKIFMQKILSSLVNSKVKPEIIALVSEAVALAAYNSKTCDYLKELEADGVKILVSESCADYMGITEAIGAGTAVDMSEIFEEIFSCERSLNL